MGTIRTYAKSLSYGKKAVKNLSKLPWIALKLDVICWLNWPHNCGEKQGKALCNTSTAKTYSDISPAIVKHVWLLHEIQKSTFERFNSYKTDTTLNFWDTVIDHLGKHNGKNTSSGTANTKFITNLVWSAFCTSIMFLDLQSVSQIWAS